MRQEPNGSRQDSADGDPAGSEPAHSEPRGAAPAETGDVAAATPDDDTDPTDPPADPAQMLRMIAEQREATRRGTEPNGLVLFGAWGLAWLVGYLTLYGTYDAAVGRSAATGFIVFALCLIAAGVVTGVHIGRRSVGVRGDSATSGALYGWAWFISFALATLLFTGLGRVGASPEVMVVVTNGVTCLVVAALYMAGGAFWREWRMFALGAWIALIGGVASLVPAPSLYLVMALAGGGGFLVAAAVDRLQVGARGGA